MEKTKIILEEIYDSSFEEAWMKTVDVIYWEHNYETKEYIIKYKELIPQ